MMDVHEDFTYDSRKKSKSTSHLPVPIDGYGIGLGSTYLKFSRSQIVWREDGNFHHGEESDAFQEPLFLVQDKKNVEIDEVATKKARFYRLVKTAVLVATFISMGMYSEITGPALMDLKERTNSNFEGISRTLVGRSVGFLTANLVGGFMCDRYNRLLDVFFAVAMAIAATCTGVIPWCDTELQLTIMFLGQGIGEGVMVSGSMAHVMKMWGEEAAIPLHLVNLAFGVGAFIAPFFVKPFLHVHHHNSHKQTDSANISNIDNDTLVDGISVYAKSSIEYPYMAIAGFVALVSFTYLVLHFKGMPKGVYPETEEKTITVREVFSPASCIPGDKAVGVPTLLLLAIFLFHSVGGERVCGKFLFTFAIEGDLMDKGQAATLNATFWGCFLLGRALALVESKWIHTRWMLVVQTLGALTAAVVLAVFAPDSVVVLWVFSSVFGVFFSPVIPTSFAWSNRYMEMKSMAIALLMLGGACGGFTAQWVTGYLIENYGFKSIMYVLVEVGIGLVVINIAMQIIGGRGTDRFLDTPQSSDVDSESTKSSRDTFTAEKEKVFELVSTI